MMIPTNNLPMDEEDDYGPDDYGYVGQGHNLDEDVSQYSIIIEQPNPN